ncbi:hypothetical protein [Streptomyces colonosanans]|uniref:hypothetical protein n=1 Tax=Streptomyces colonosanans TaxID=1428652 RepID=UPI00115FE01A|nr:hypothetical protein [Streptomyces colonosanans]
MTSTIVCVRRAREPGHRESRLSGTQLQGSGATELSASGNGSGVTRLSRAFRTQKSPDDQIVGADQLLLNEIYRELGPQLHHQHRRI